MVEVELEHGDWMRFQVQGFQWFREDQRVYEHETALVQEGDIIIYLKNFSWGLGITFSGIISFLLCFFKTLVYSRRRQSVWYK